MDLFPLFSSPSLKNGKLTSRLSFPSSNGHTIRHTDFLSHRYSVHVSTLKDFRFADLPAEIRNQIYRYILIHTQPVKLDDFWGRERPTRKSLAIVFANRLIYSEAMPIFLSHNSFAITGQRKEHTWLRRMRPEGRSELRNITVQVKDGRCNHDFSFYNALSLCPRVHLTLNVRPSRLVEVSREGSLRNMHGFAAVTSETLPQKQELCLYHRQTRLADWEVTQKHDRMRRYELLLQEFQAPCVGKCRAHKGREGTHTQATIHISHDQTCYYCC